MLQAPAATISPCTGTKMTRHGSLLLHVALPAPPIVLNGPQRTANMIDIIVITLVIAFLLILVAATQPLAARLQISPTILLAAMGVAVGSAAAFLLHTTLTDAFNELVAPIVGFPVRSAVFLYILLPLLLFQASLSLEVRRIMEDYVPILVLAVLAVLLAAAVIGVSLEQLYGIPLLIALMLGSIVATTDPAAVVTIFREIGAPARLTRLVEGESLLNDAAAIALFALLLEVVAAGEPLDLVAASIGLVVSFTGGAVVGALAGRGLASAMSWMKGIAAAEVTLTLGATYILYIVCDQVLEVSGVVAVVASGLTLRATIPARIKPANWQRLCSVWEQIGFWAGSLIFLLAAILVPRILTDINIWDIILVLTVVVAALLARAIVLFGVMPLLALTGLAVPVSTRYNLTILWGGLRGAVTLALALVVTENYFIDPEVKRFVAVTATGYVLFTLFVNGLTLRPLIRKLGLDKLSPIDLAVRDQVVALSLAEVADRVKGAGERYGIEPKIVRSVVRDYAPEIKLGDSSADIEELLTDRERLTLGLIALAAHEKELILEHHETHTIDERIVGEMLRGAERLLEGARQDGRVGYNRAYRVQLSYGLSTRLAYRLHRHLGLDGPLKRRIGHTFQALMVQSLVLTEMAAYLPARMTPLLGQRITDILADILDSRAAATRTALEALRLQYPDYAEALEAAFLRQIGTQYELAHYDELHREGLLSQEVHDSLRRSVSHHADPGRQVAKLEIKISATQALRSMALFAHLTDVQIALLAKRMKSRYVLPGEALARPGDTRLALFFIASGAVEIRRDQHTIRLGPGEFFGEMALLASRPRAAHVTSLTFCNLLVLDEAAFRAFWEEEPSVRQAIEETAQARLRMMTAE